MRPELETLASLSRAVGDDLELVQGPGGNTSVKTSGPRPQLLIKASGFRLSEVGPDSACAGLDLEALRRIFSAQGLQALDPLEAHESTSRQVAELALEGPRASMETAFHVDLDRVVLHTHPVLVNALACARGGRERLLELWPESSEGAPLWIEAAVPGYPLAAKITRAMTQRTETPSQLILASHGLITSGDTAEEALAATRSVVEELRTRLGGPLGSAEPGDPSPVVQRWAETLQSLLATANPAVLARPVRRLAIQDAIRSPDPRRTVGPLVPDDVVYGLHRASCIDPGPGPGRWWAEHGPDLSLPCWIELRGEGAVLVGRSARELDFMEENLLANTWIHGLIRRQGLDPVLLPAALIDQILGLGSEKYRQSLAARGRAGGDRA